MKKKIFTIVLLFTVSFLINIISAIKITKYFVVSDEAIYTAFSRNIIATKICPGVKPALVNQAFQYDNLPNFIYPLIISPAFCVHTFSMTLLLIKSINSCLLALGTVFLYLILINFFNPSLSLAFALLSPLSVYSNFSGIIMVESLSYTTFAIFILLALNILNKNDRHQASRLILFGFFCAFCYYVKINFIFLPLLFLITLVLKNFTDHLPPKQLLYQSCCFLTLYSISFISIKFFYQHFIYNSSMNYYQSNLLMYSRAQPILVLQLFFLSFILFFSNLTIFSIWPILSSLFDIFKQIFKRQKMTSYHFLYLLTIPSIFIYLTIFSIHSSTINLSPFTRNFYIIHEREYGFLITPLLILLFLNLPRINKVPIKNLVIYIIINTLAAYFFMNFINRFEIGMELIPSPSFIAVIINKNLYSLILLNIFFPHIITLVFHKHRLFQPIFLLFFMSLFLLLKISHINRFNSPKFPTDPLFKIPNDYQLITSPEDQIVTNARTFPQAYKVLATNNYSPQLSFQGPKEFASILYQKKNTFFIDNLLLNPNSLIPTSTGEIVTNYMDNTMIYKAIESGKGYLVSIPYYYQDNQPIQANTKSNIWQSPVSQYTQNYAYINHNSLNTYQLCSTYKQPVSLRFEYLGHQATDLEMIISITHHFSLNGDRTNLSYTTSSFQKNYTLFDNKPISFSQKFSQSNNFIDIKITSFQRTGCSLVDINIDNIFYNNQSVFRFRKIL